jgi:hypothetical protein
MKWLFRLIASIRAWWRKRRRRNVFDSIVRLDAACDPTEALKDGRLVIIGTVEKAKWLRFKCPCRCGNVIALNLMRSHYPHWTISLNQDNTLTVNPSVDATTCGSHFWIRRNQIQWV